MYASLSFGEITFYCVTWVSAVFYSVYQLWDATHFMNPNRYKAYEVGWSISVKDDSSDYEWQMWVPFLLFKVPWLVSHFVGAELVRRNNIELLPVWYVLISAIFLLNYVGAFATAVLVMKCALIYALHLLRSRILLWAVCVTLIIGYNMGDIVDVLSLERREHYMMSVCGSWVLLRCIGFCLDALNARRRGAATADGLAARRHALRPRGRRHHRGAARPTMSAGGLRSHRASVPELAGAGRHGHADGVRAVRGGRWLRVGAAAAVASVPAPAAAVGAACRDRAARPAD